MNSIVNYFTQNFGNLLECKIDSEVVKQINKLNRAGRSEIRYQLFRQAKAFEGIKETEKIIAWLQSCFEIIDNYSFRFNNVYFSPGRKIKESIESLLSEAQSSVYLCVFTITDYDLAQHILNCYKRGAEVRIITDDEKTTAKGSEIYRLIRAGIQVKTDHSHYHMHNKFGIIDKRIAITGSFNWTYTATKHNQENLLATSNFDIVQQYQSEFDRLWNEMFDF